MAIVAHADVVGRQEELAALDDFLGALPDGPAGFVLSGDAGVGKTTLWLAAVDAARDRGYRVLSTRPAEAEARLAFAGLGDLFDTELEDILEELPEPQADALRIALLLERPSGPPPDERTVAVAVLSSLRLLSADGPLLVASDDVQWLDSASALALGFAWRRVRTEPIGLLLAHRVGEPAPGVLAAAAIQRLDVRPLSLGAVHRLLRARLDLNVSRPTLRRIHDAAAGNAFFALELGRALERGETTLSPGEPLPVPDELRALVRGRVVALPDVTRDALAAAAALSQPTLPLLETAGFEEDALRPALEAHMLELDGNTVRFAHPLLASGAYRDLDPEAQRELHRRLAPLVFDDEEQARHLALATDGPDSNVAGALERAAVHARRRGATSAAGELAAQAVRLTPDSCGPDRHRRRIAAGLYSFDAGDAERSASLLDAALAEATTGAERAEALAALARLHRFKGDQPHAAELARRALADPDAADAVRAEAAQGLAATLFYLREEIGEGVRFAALGAELASRAGDRRLAAESLCVQSLLECIAGRSAATVTMERAASFADASTHVRVLSSPAFHSAVFALWTDDPRAAELLRGCRDDAVGRGDEGSIPMVLAQLALAEYLCGRCPEADEVASDGYELAQQTGQRPMEAYSVATRALARASLGLEDEARADAQLALELAGERGMAAARIHGVWALGLLELSLDRPEETARILAPQRERLLAAGVAEPGTIRFVPDEVEALVQLGALDDAETVLGWLEDRARVLDRVSASAAAARCRGLLHSARGETEQAFGDFERALAEHARVTMPFERARTLLAFGAAQRRAKRKRQARTTLGEALAAFEDLGATLWAAKARAELASIGGRASSGDELTPAETRVATLVAEGRTNREVAAALYVTEHTVEFHLSGIYRKLGVRSRAGLARQFRG